MSEKTTTWSIGLSFWIIGPILAAVLAAAVHAGWMFTTWLVP